MRPHILSCLAAAAVIQPTRAADARDYFLNFAAAAHGGFTSDGTRSWNSFTIAQLGGSNFAATLQDSLAAPGIGFEVVSVSGTLFDGSAAISPLPALTWFDSASAAQTSWVAFAQDASVTFKLTGFQPDDALSLEWIASRDKAEFRRTTVRVNGSPSNADAGKAVSSSGFVTNQNTDEYMRWQNVFANPQGEILISVENVSNGPFALASAVANAVRITVTPDQDPPESAPPYIHNFDAPAELAAFQIEQKPGGTTTIAGGKLVIDDAAGATVWFREKLEAPYVIEYEVAASSQRRVSDINCFWNATNPGSAVPLIDNAAGRDGDFSDYDSLQLYYVGLGGNDNSSTRFRRYPGDGTRPLLPEHDLSAPEFLIEADTVYHIQIRSDGRHTQFLRDGRVIFDILDDEPFTSGWFGFRTVDARLEIDNFKVTAAAPEILNLMGAQSAFGYFSTTPENPSASLIAFVTCSRLPLSRPEFVPGALWVADLDGDNARRIADIAQLDNHNGAEGMWVDDHTLAFTDGELIRVVDTDTEAEVAGPWQGKSSHESMNGKLLFAVDETDHPTLARGVYEADVVTDTVSLLLSYAQIAALDFPGLGPGATNLQILHLQYSTDASHIAMRVNRPGVAEIEKFLVTCLADGSDLRIFGPKPMHYLWFDADTMAGHDNQIDDGQPNDRSVRRWTRDAVFIETLAPPGNHLALGPDRDFYASETWYGSDPVIISVHTRGTGPAASRVIHDSSHLELVWELGMHVNPSFSRDGRRVYFNLPTDYGGSQIAAVDLDHAAHVFGDSEMVRGPAGAISIEWDSLSGAPYRLQSSGNLLDWTNEGPPITGAGSRMSAPLPGPPPSGSRFHRVKFGG